MPILTEHTQGILAHFLALKEFPRAGRVFR